MKSLRDVLLAIGIATLVTIAVSAGEAGERLFVLTAPFDDPGPGTILAFDIGADGLPAQAESYPTMGLGSSSSGPQDVVIDAGGRFLFAANNEGQSITVYVISEEDGTLQPVLGSPFHVPEPNLGASPFFLAVTSDASFLFATTDRGLKSFRVDDDGALSHADAVPLLTSGLATAPDGSHLFAVGWPDRGVHAFRISAEGGLHEVAGSPFEYDDRSRGWRLVLSEDGRRLWLLDLDTGIAAFDVDDRGALRFTGQTEVGEFAEAFESAMDDRYLYAGIPFAPEIRGYSAIPAVPVELATSPFAAEYTAVALLASRDDSRLYQVNREVENIASFAIDTGGGLAPIGSPVPIDTEGEAIANGAAYLAPRTLQVTIDVKPGSAHNPINLRGRGVIPVAILGTAELDLHDVDQASVRFGPGAAIPAHGLPHGLEDIDGDGGLDLVLHFRVDASGLACGDTTVSLVGSTFDGRGFRGVDTIDVLGCARFGARTPAEWPPAPDGEDRPSDGVVNLRRSRDRSD